MRSSAFVTSLALFTAAASAWPSGWDALDVVKEAARLRIRQDNNDDETTSRTSFDLSLSATQGNTATTERTTRATDDASETSSGSGSRTTNNNDDNEDETSSGRSSGGSRTSTGRGSDRSGSATSTKTFDNRLPAGGVKMQTPDPMAGAKYYKIKDYVTFGFNFTSLSVTPSRIDILATNSLNSQTYTIAANHSVTMGDDAVQAVTWDTGEYQSTASVPLLMGTYTMIIHDASKDADAAPMAGYLGSWNQFNFGMYTPQPYTPLADFVCATCNPNAARSNMEKQTLAFVFGIVGVTVMSFGWFAGVAGLW